MVDYASISIVLTGLGLMIAITYYAFTIRNQNRTRQAQLFMQTHAQWRDRHFIESFHDMLSWEWDNLQDYADRLLTDTEKVYTSTEVIWYFEGVGELLKKGLIDIDIVFTMYADRFINWAEKYIPILKALREYYVTPWRYRNIEYLYEQMKKRQGAEMKKYGTK